MAQKFGKCPFCFKHDSDGQEFEVHKKEVWLDRDLQDVEITFQCLSCNIVFVANEHPEFLIKEMAIEDPLTEADAERLING